MRLPSALAVSLSLHVFVVLGGLVHPRTASQESQLPLQATLVAPPRPVPTLIAPESPEEAPAKVVKPSRVMTAPAKQGSPVLPQPDNDLVTAASRQVARVLLYPTEAIARGLEGEAVVMLFLDTEGNAAAARLERSSGHPILDDAAVRAARQVRALPTGIAQDFLLPVRFRLH
jgi:protein TonB